MHDKLKELYQQMATHTLPECAGTCEVPFSCCTVDACELTRRWAQNSWGIKLQKTNHAKLPFMGEHGCTVEPYLRPLCTLHTCQINAFGYKPDDGKWTERYFHLRGEINYLECERVVI